MGVHRQNPLVFFVTFVVHFRLSHPKWIAVEIKRKAKNMEFGDFFSDASGI